MSAFAVAIGAKADIAFCAAHVGGKSNVRQYATGLGALGNLLPRYLSKKPSWFPPLNWNDMSNDALPAKRAEGGEPQMNTWDEYRVKAAELSARAACETDAQIQAELESLAQSYLRLALQAEQNNRLDLSYETPLPKDDDPAAKR